jgi:hypothetical protein
MFSIQGQQCTIKKSKNLKKKPIQISLFINKQENLGIREKVRFRSTARSEDRKCFFHLDPGEMNKQSTSVILQSKKLNRTPTPSKNQKINYLEYEFEPPKLQITGAFLFSIQGRDKQRSSLSRRRRSLKSDENTDRKTCNSVKNRITMNDLGVNLPSIIRSKKVKKKFRYRPQLVEDIFAAS